MAKPITASEAKRLIHGDGEIALIDVREAGEFGEGHLLFAVPCPYSRLEFELPRLVPRLDTAVILCDGADGVAGRAAKSLEGLGYSDIMILDGGVAAWENAGYSVFKGVNVPSKLLGELAEHELKPQRITAQTLADWQSSGKSFHFFDTRPPIEHAKMRVPGSVCLPNGELAHRIHAAVGTKDATIVITCAGRTRGLIGAAGLKVAGVENPVFALENGTQGWALAGFELERGNTAGPYPVLDPAAADDSRRRGQALADGEGLPFIAADQVRALMEDRTRTVHVIDVRSAPEVRDQPISVARPALGGQLVQSTDQWIGTRRSRVVLVDDTGLRAALAGYWLKRLGYEISLHRIEEATFALSKPEPTWPVVAPLPLIAPAIASMLSEQGKAAMLDLRSSAAYRSTHAAGALWSIRPQLDRIGRLAGKAIVVFADEVPVAEAAAVDLRRAEADEVYLVEGGLEGWRQAGLAVVEGDPQPAPDRAIDFLQFVHDRHDGNLDAARQYLAWEQGLMSQIDATERAEFKL